MANSSRSLYYVYERSGSRVKHAQDEGCEPQLRPKKNHTQFSKKKKLLYIKSVLICSTTLSETFLIKTRIARDAIISVLRASYKVLIILVIF